MARVTAAEVSTIRRSSRIRQQMISSPKVIASTSTPSSTKRRKQKPPPRKKSSSKGTASTPTTPFPLLHLPREIRDMIYTLLVSTGHLSILRTSHEINIEAHSTFYRAAICRQNAGYFSRGQKFPSNTSSKLLFQNFELRCNLDTGPNPPDPSKPRGMQTQRRDLSVSFRRASYFGRGDIRRNRMVIELSFNKKTPLLNAEYSIEKYLDEPECFIGFRHLVVKILPKPRRWDTAEQDRISQVVRDILEPKLGPAILYEGEGKWDDGACIEFHPWSLVGQQSYRLEPVWYLKQATWDRGGRDVFREEDDE